MRVASWQGVPPPAPRLGVHPPSLSPTTATTAGRLRDDRWTHVERLLAALLVFALGTNYAILSGLTIGCGLAIVTSPLWIWSLRLYHYGWLVAISGTAAAVSGYTLSALHSDWLFIDEADRSAQLWLIGSLTTGVGALMWARTKLAGTTVAALYGLGLLAAAPTRLTGAADNPWKFLLSVPVSLIILALIEACRRGTGAVLLALGVLILTSVLLDSRSFTGVLALTACLVVWENRPARRRVTQWWGWSMTTLGLLAFGVYQLATEALVSGLLGEAAQRRTVQQIASAGSLILGGRPELMATFGLFKSHPFGFGMGTTLDVTTINDAKSSMKLIGYNPNNGYVDHFMFEKGITLHSGLGDLWARCGLLGAFFGLVLLIIIMRGLLDRVARKESVATLGVLCLWSLWSLFFGPLLAAVPVVVITCGLAGLPNERRTSGPLRFHRPPPSYRD